ncbi:MAG: AAA family ATPase [Synechococcaceae cyanobacterium]|nr:AAA family ATPase [Synechococcaceae cyanobacterium]
MTATPLPPEEGGWLGPLAGSLAEALPRLYGEPLDPLVREVILVLAAGLGQGQLELPLGGPAPEGISAAEWPEGHRQALSRSRLCQEPDGPLALLPEALAPTAQNPKTQNPKAQAPETVAWRRWSEQRDQVLAELLARAARPPAWASPAQPQRPASPTANRSAANTAGTTGAETAGPTTPALAGMPQPGPPQAQAIARPEPEPPALPPLGDQQLQAVEALRRHGLVLLEGGPGTGKTSTVRGMLAELRQHQPEARVQLAAPTGKAAARLRATCGVEVPCTTVHRLLESRGDRFQRHRRNPLALDLLVLDEVSMLDQALMAAVLEALPSHCQLVLVGDAAQLPPIAPGAVLQELQRPDRRQQLGAAAVTLSRVYRNAGSIAAVAAQLREGLEAGTPPLAHLRPLLQRLGPNDNLAWQEVDSNVAPAAALAAARQQQQRLATLAQRWHQATANERPALQQQLLHQRERLLLLTPRRRGRWGVEGLHQQLLGERAQRPADQWPSGTPVLCCRNLPELGLANGDLGVLVGPEESSNQRRLLFEAPGQPNEVLLLHPALLAGAVEPALALTVHKAQGSEAEAVIVLMAHPDASDGRLLYTALTRARQRALLITGRGQRG